MMWHENSKYGRNIKDSMDNRNLKAGLNTILTLIFASIFVMTVLFAKSIVTDAVLSSKLISLVSDEESNTVTLREQNHEITKFDYINLFYEGKPVFLGEIISKDNRYYLPINKFVVVAGGTIIQDKDKLAINLKNKIIIDILKEEYIETQESFQDLDDYNVKWGESQNENKLFEPFVSSQNYYVSVFDLCESLSLISDWDNSTKTISFYNMNQVKINPSKKESRNKASEGKSIIRPALIRLEDIAPIENDSASNDDLLKRRIVADYLYSKEVPFSVALVTRYINAEEGIDNDLSEDYSFYNAQFIYTLDYYKGRGGTIGLHGYTHQNGLGKSLFDKEFGPDVNLEIGKAKERVEKAITACAKIGIKPAFFFFPHYISTSEELLYVAKRFDTIYQTEQNKVNYKRYGLHKTKYIPTPLHYLDSSDDEDKLLKKISSVSRETLMSMFFHPFLDYKYIDIIRDTKDNGGIKISYSENSMLHRIVNAVEESGANFVSIYDIK